MLSSCDERENVKHERLINLPIVFIRPSQLRDFLLEGLYSTVEKL